jgi:hypothetical protein
MKDSALRKLACDISNKIYCAIPWYWHRKMCQDTTNLLHEGLKVVNNQNSENRLEALRLVSTMRTSPSICGVMSGVSYTETELINMLDKIADLLNINLPDLK